MLRQYKLKDYSFRLVLWVIILSVLGIFVIGSADSDYVLRQVAGLALGVICMVIVSLMDYTWLIRFHWIYYFVGLVLLGIVQLVGTNVNGATRWIDLGFTRFQPSDVMKIILIVFFTRYFTLHEENLSKLKTIIKALFLIAVPAALILTQPDLSTTIVVLLVFSSLYFIAGLSYKIIGGIILVCVPLVIVLMTIITQPNQTLISTENYQYKRVMAWLHPEDYPDIAYQQTNSKIAIGSGQLYGKGLNNSNVGSVKNANYISEPQTDFIFAVAGEELGFIGCCIIVILEFLIAIECALIGRKARDLDGTLICCGMASLIAFQSFINICVATGLMPNTGLPLPFVSYGLTSLVSLFIGIGLVLNIGLQVRKY